VTPTLIIALFLAGQTPAAPDPDEAGDTALVTQESTQDPALSSVPVPYRPPVRPFEMPASVPVAPVPYGAAPRAIPAPVQVEQYQRSYEGPQNEVERYYERGVKAAFDTKQSIMGPLDGEWRVKAITGQSVLTLLLNDPGNGLVDGAWLDTRAGSGGTTGLLDSASREGVSLVVRFDDKGAPTTIRLRPDGVVWRGDMEVRGTTSAVVMSR
jgi:hypothetical protein